MVMSTAEDRSFFLPVELLGIQFWLSSTEMFHLGLALF